MIIVYDESKAQSDVFYNPKYFKTPITGVKEVYTDVEAIKKSYEKVGAKVKPLKDYKPKKEK